MRIELLRQRENFDDGFIASLSEFLANKYQWQGKIYWSKGLKFNAEKTEKNHSRFYTNDLLNILYPAELSRSTLSPFTKEFVYNPNVFKWLLQRIYVFAAVRFPLQFFVTSATLIVENAPKEMASWVFIPGNHSHRIIDLTQKISMVFLKRGFNVDFLKADAFTRLSYEFLPSPQVLDYKVEQKWFVEQQITGLPLNRLHNAKDREQAIQQANKAMLALYDVTQQSMALDKYVQRLMPAIKNQIEAIKTALTGEEHTNLLELACDLKLLILQKPNENKETVVLVLSHGDYQAANILLDKPNVWLIDWEYAGSRSLYFDYFCYVLNSRLSAGLSDRIDELNDKLTLDGLFDDLPLPILAGQHHFLWLFLLEELSLKLSEVSTAEIDKKMTNIMPWIIEIRAVKQFKKFK